jgi:hypothetical protein
MMRRADFEEHIGKENICDNFADALERGKHYFARSEAELTHP